MKTKIFGLTIPMFLVICIIVFIATRLNVLSSDLAGGIALMLTIGIVFNEIGERIPIWNSYIGGGLVLAFLGTAILVYYKIIPENYVKLMDSVTSEPMGALDLFIIVLITGSILGLNRQLMIKSFTGYIPAIFGGLIGAVLLGVLGGLLFGVKPSDAILKYVLPIMGGGNGAGAIPLSQIYERVTGHSRTEYYAFAIAVLTIANIFAIISAGILNNIGTRKPSWTGDGNTLMRKSSEINEEDEKVDVKLKDYCGSLLLTVTLYELGRVFSNYLWPFVSKKVPIHTFAWMILFVAIANATGLIPSNIRHACKNMQSFFTKNVILIIMVGVGADTKLQELISACTPANVVIALLIVVGAILGSALVGYLVGFYPVDSAMTAGLCMANRGGSGDLAVLGAGKRMGLMAYAQLSSRLGGGIVLVLGSILFGLFQ